MFQSDTILVRREPLSTEENPFPYDRIRVIGPSPVVYSASSGWAGVQANGIVVEPLTSFAPNINEPLGKLQQDYTIEYEPPPLEFVSRPVVMQAQGKTPEEVFASAAREEKPRGRKGS